MDNNHELKIKRRHFLTGASGAAIGIGLTQPVLAASAPLGDEMIYEVQRTDAQWQAMLSVDEFEILRKRGTEVAKSSPLWNETRDGLYHCKGCDLTSYDARWKTIVDKGWVFFFHSEPNAVLTDVEGPTPKYGGMITGLEAKTELHCRRCGSHLGHYVYIEDRKMHCINGASLVFKPKNT